MKIKHFLSILIVTILLASCTEKVQEKKLVQEKEFDYLVDQFADLKILRYQIPGFKELTLKEKKFVYYLTQAGLSGSKTFTLRLLEIKQQRIGRHLKNI
jgi:dipeptidyl-peptidase-3